MFNVKKKGGVKLKPIFTSVNAEINTILGYMISCMGAIAPSPPGFTLA